jgi:subtilisin family serine protease
MRQSFAQTLVSRSRRYFMRITVFISILVTIAVMAAGVPKTDAVDATPAKKAVSAAMNITDGAANVVIEVTGRDAFQRVHDLASSLGIAVPFSSEETGILTLSADGIDERVLREVAAIPGVVSLSSEHKVRALFTPNDPETSLHQWNLDPINAYEAWDISKGTHDVVVAVLDTGIDWTHPDLAANIWNDSSGYHGYNFISNNHLPMDDNINSYDEVGGWDTNTYVYHGTHVAGVVGAVINNNIGIAGIAQVRLMAVKVMNDSGEGTDATVASGIRWAVDNGANIVTMSLGVDGPSATLQNQIAYACQHGVVTIAASGNSGSSMVSYPAAYPSVIAVGAVDSSLRRATFSNFGSGLDIMAPGVQIYSTRGGGGYQSLSGTSTAAPHVAGVVALMLSVNPALTPTEVGSVMNATATDISRAGYDTATGWGVVDAFRAVEQIASPTVTITDYPSFAPLNTTVSISWLVSGGSPGNIQRTYIMWGESATSMTQTSPDSTGNTWARFTYDGVRSPDHNATLYIQAVAYVDGSLYQSDILQLPVHNAPSDGLLAQFLKDVQDFIFNRLGIYNFLLVLAILIAIPAIAIAARPKRRPVRTSIASPSSQLHDFQALQPVRYLPPPPPPPPRFEAYVDVLGHEVMPSVMSVVEGTKVVWVNRQWAPPPGIAIRSGRLDQTGEHPDGLFESGLLIAPGDYWSATFHKVGTYEYYLTGIWKSAKVIVEPHRPAGTQGSTAS